MLLCSQNQSNKIMNIMCVDNELVLIYFKIIYFGSNKHFYHLNLIGDQLKQMQILILNIRTEIKTSNIIILSTKLRRSLDLVGFDFEEVSCDDIMVSVILLLVLSLLVRMGTRELRRESLAKSSLSIVDLYMTIDLCHAKNVSSPLSHLLLSQCKM